jgi:hypothetical protein
MKRLNGWQRIGIALSVLWVMTVGAFTLHDVSAIEQHYPIDYAALAAAAGGYTMLPSSPTFDEWLLQNQLSTSLKEWADRRTEQIETKPTPEQEQSYLQWRDSIFAEYKREMTVDAEQDFPKELPKLPPKRFATLGSLRAISSCGRCSFFGRCPTLSELRGVGGVAASR